MKKALLVISFGTSYMDTYEKNIKAIEKELISSYPDYDFFRAYTSRKIIRKLKDRDNWHVELPAEAMTRIKDLGYTEVLCQMTHVINGYEYELTLKDIEVYKEDLDIRIGRPLLTDYEDYKTSVNALMNSIPPLNKNEGLILMGHGTYHHANSAYPCLDYVFKAEGHENVYVASVEGFPFIEDVIERLKTKGNIQKVYLMPFMIVAGDHAINDMAGDEEDSWKTLVKEAGFEVTVLLKGLGEIPEIRRLFVEHSNKSFKFV